MTMAVDLGRKATEQTRIRLNDLIHIVGEGVNSTIIQCVHEQSLTGICIFHVFYLHPMDHLCTNR